MGTNVSEDGTISLPIQLYQGQSEAGFHTLQDGDEINREDVTDDLTQGFHILVNLERVIHGTESKDPDGKEGHPATFIVIKFRFHGLSVKRRFRSVKITIRFEDETRPLEDDPEVRDMWPNNSYTLSKSVAKIQDTKSIVGAVSGGASGASGSVTAKWERQVNTDRNDRATLYGAPVRRQRKFGKKNAIYIALDEDKTDRSSVVAELRTAILLRRRVGTDRFRAHFDVDAEADSGYEFARGLRKLTGRSHVTDPVTLKPGVQLLGRPKEWDGTPAIEQDKLDSVMLETYGEAISTSELDPVRKPDEATKKDGGAKANDGAKSNEKA